jgi:hypothetical protein
MSEISLPIIPEKFELTPEFRLLAACSWTAPPALEQDQAEKIAALCRGGIDWEAFLRLVCNHEVQALVYESLRRNAENKIPDIIMASLKNWKVQISVKSLHHAAEMLGMVAKFAELGVNLLPLKGEMLSFQLYGDIGMRNSCDIDMLVDPECLDMACQLLEAEGYTCSLLGHQLTTKQRAYLKTNFHHLEYGHATKNICLELHWRFGSFWLPGQMKMLWSRTIQIEWMGRKIYSLDDDDQLLFLCDHGARHGFYSLKWASDIARILASERLQGWESLLELAESLDLKRTLASSVLLAHWLYDIPLAEQFKELIRNDKKAVSISITMYTMLCLSEATKNSMGKSKGSLKLAWQKLRLRPSFPIRAALKPKLVAIFDFLDFPLPDRLFWLYYPLRPVSLIWRHFLQKSPVKRT